MPQVRCRSIQIEKRIIVQNQNLISFDFTQCYQVTIKTAQCSFILGVSRAPKEQYKKKKHKKLHTCIPKIKITGKDEVGLFLILTADTMHAKCRTFSRN